MAVADAPASAAAPGDGRGAVLLAAAAVAVGVGWYEITKKPKAATTPVPTPVPTPAPNGVPGYSTRPSWFGSVDMQTRQCAQLFFTLIGRWPDLADAQAMAADVATCPSSSVNCGGQSGLHAAAYYVLLAPTQEAEQRINVCAAVRNTAPINWNADWIWCAYHTWLQRDPSADELVYWANMLNRYGSVSCAYLIGGSTEMLNNVISWAAVQ